MSDEIRRLSDELARHPASLVFVPLADALRKAGQLDVALRVALRGLDRHPYVADGHDILARIHADRGDLERAADEWGMALRIDPSHAAARKGLSFIDYRRGDLASAERRLAEASNGGSGDASVAVALARVRSALAARGAAVEPAPPMEAASTLNDAHVDDDIGHTRADALEATARPPLPREFPPPDTGLARAIFAPTLDRDQAALLLDEDGLVLAGAYLDSSGTDVAEYVGAELAGVSGEAERAMRHLGLGAWTSLLAEADNAVVAMTPAPRRSLLLVAASHETPLGLVRLLLDRSLARARDWLARVS